MKFNTIEEVIADIKSGRMIVVLDDEDRENEGDLIIPASFVTPENINFMTKHGRGLICAPMEEKRLVELGTFPKVPDLRCGKYHLVLVHMVLG